MLKVENLTVRFGGLVAVNAVSLAVSPHEILGLVGPNGAGKTTLFNAVSGLVRPTSGHVLFHGDKVEHKPLHKRARMGIGRTFQVPQPLHGLTVRENLVVAQRFGKGRVDMAHIDEILELTNLLDKAGHDAATQLALTELKALEVAKALATEPTLLMLDEVLGGLETAGKRRFMGMLKALQERFDLSILIIEHDIETVSSLCHRVAVLNYGELIADGSPEQVFRDPEVIKSYLGAEHA